MQEPKKVILAGNYKILGGTYDRLDNVSKFYYNKGIITSGFTKVNLELNAGEFVVITGESGSGKSTLLNVISGLDTYEEGEMYINGQETSHYTEQDVEEYRNKKQIHWKYFSKFQFGKQLYSLSKY